MNNKINIALIGAGYWGKNLLRDLNTLKCLSTVCEINHHLLKEIKENYPNISTTSNYDSILKNSDITAIVIALPAEQHYEFAKKALENNKDVFVEKPLSLKVEHGKELVALAKKNNKILMVGHLMHYHPCIVAIKQMLSRKLIGKIFYINCSRKNLGIIRKNENVLWSLAPHDISIILSLIGNKEIVDLKCIGEKHLNNSVHDVTNTFIKFDDNIHCNISVNWLYPYKEQKMTIVGSDGMIIFDNTKPIEQKIVLCKNYITTLQDKKRELTKPVFQNVIVKGNNDTPLLTECKQFIQSCITRQAPFTDGKEGVRVLEILEKCQNELNKEISYAHSSSIISDNAVIGELTNIWHFTHVMNATIGDQCILGQGCFVGDNVVIGNNVKIQNNCSIFDGVTIENNVFVGPHVVFTNVNVPRVEHPVDKKYIKTLVCEGASIGANSTIRCGVTLGKYCMIGAGSVVTKNVKPYTVVMGNPAKEYKKITKEGVLKDF